MQGMWQCSVPYDLCTVECWFCDTDKEAATRLSDVHISITVLLRPHRVPKSFFFRQFIIDHFLLCFIFEPQVFYFDSLFLLEGM